METPGLGLIEAHIYHGKNCHHLKILNAFSTLGKNIKH
jgi:hypothetical protein